MTHSENGASIRGINIQIDITSYLENKTLHSNIIHDFMIFLVI